MTSLNRLVPTLAALNGVLAVTFGTSGAHLVADARAQSYLMLAATFGLAHAAAALAALALAPSRTGRTAALLLSLGALVFASTLAAIAFGGPRWLGAITPGGGTLMLLGWVLLLALFATGRARH